MTHDGEFTITKYRDVEIGGHRYRVFPCPKCGLDIYHASDHPSPSSVWCQQSPEGCNAHFTPTFTGMTLPKTLK